MSRCDKCGRDPDPLINRSLLAVLLALVSMFAAAVYIVAGTWMHRARACESRRCIGIVVEQAADGGVPGKDEGR